jgi:hypothetical protein
MFQVLGVLNADYVGNERPIFKYWERSHASADARGVGQTRTLQKRQAWRLVKAMVGMSALLR